MQESVIGNQVLPPILKFKQMNWNMNWTFEKSFHQVSHGILACENLVQTDSFHILWSLEYVDYYKNFSDPFKEDF